MELDTVVCGDVLDWATSYQGPRFHAILSDPPYAWEFMGHKETDGDVALRPETWAALAEHLYPGAFIFAFAGPRTYHRLACAMEDAGLRLHAPVVWINAQGFPKATRIMAGEFEATGELCLMHSDASGNYDDDNYDWGERYQRAKEPVTDLAHTWAGHRYGLQAMKPCAEIIAIAQKPYNGRPVDSIVSTGAGALNIEAGRIKTNGRDVRTHPGGLEGIFVMGSGLADGQTSQGRWPPNVCFSHIPDHYFCSFCQAVYPMQPVVEVCPDCGGELEWREGCKRVGVERTSSHNPGNKGPTNSGNLYGEYAPKTPHIGYADPDGYETIAAYACVCGCEECGATWAVEPRVEKGNGEAVFNKVDSVTPSAAGYTRPNKSMYTHKPEGNLRSYGKEAVALHQRGPCPECGSPRTRWLCPVAGLGEQSGERDISGSAKSGKPAIGEYPGGYGGYAGIRQGLLHNDKGTAARYYYRANWEAEQGEWECVGECPIARLDEQAGDRNAHAVKTRESCKGGVFGGGANTDENRYYDEGSASRFYFNTDFAAETAERLAQEDPFRYCPKAAKSERQKGLNDFYWKRDKTSPSGFVRVSKEEWETLDKRERAQGNIHSTVKPISLLKWLASLLLPPPEYAPRRLLVPFTGSGSEVLAAMTVGWEEVIGVELVQDYADIANARIARARAAMAQMELPQC